MDSKEADVPAVAESESRASRSISLQKFFAFICFFNEHVFTNYLLDDVSAVFCEAAILKSFFDFEFADLIIAAAFVIDLFYFVFLPVDRGIRGPRLGLFSKHESFPFTFSEPPDKYVSFADSHAERSVHSCYTTPAFYTTAGMDPQAAAAAVLVEGTSRQGSP